MKQLIKHSYFAFHVALYRFVAKKKIMKGEYSHVFLLKKAGGAVFMGGGF